MESSSQIEAYDRAHPSERFEYRTYISRRIIPEVQEHSKSDSSCQKFKLKQGAEWTSVCDSSDKDAVDAFGKVLQEELLSKLGIRVSSRIRPQKNDRHALQLRCANRAETQGHAPCTFTLTAGPKGIRMSRSEGALVNSLHNHATLNTTQVETHPSTFHDAVANCSGLFAELLEQVRIWIQGSTSKKKSKSQILEQLKLVCRDRGIVPNEGVLRRLVDRQDPKPIKERDAQALIATLKVRFPGRSAYRTIIDEDGMTILEWALIIPTSAKSLTDNEIDELTSDGTFCCGDAGYYLLGSSVKNGDGLIEVVTLAIHRRKDEATYKEIFTVARSLAGLESIDVQLVDGEKALRNGALEAHGGLAKRCMFHQKVNTIKHSSKRPSLLQETPEAEAMREELDQLTKSNPSFVRRVHLFLEKATCEEEVVESFEALLMVSTPHERKYLTNYLHPSREGEELLRCWNAGFGSPDKVSNKMETVFSVAKCEVDASTPASEVLTALDARFSASLAERQQKKEKSTNAAIGRFLKSGTPFRLKFCNTNIKHVLELLRPGASIPLMERAEKSMVFDVNEVKVEELLGELQRVKADSRAVSDIIRNGEARASQNQKYPPPAPLHCVLIKWLEGTDTSLPRPLRAFRLKEKDECPVFCLLFERDQIICSCARHSVDKLPCEHHLRLMEDRHLAIPLISYFPSMFWREVVRQMSDEGRAELILRSFQFQIPANLADHYPARSYRFLVDQLDRVDKLSWIIGPTRVYKPKPNIESIAACEDVHVLFDDAADKAVGVPEVDPAVTAILETVTGLPEAQQSAVLHQLRPLMNKRARLAQQVVFGKSAGGGQKHQRRRRKNALDRIRGKISKTAKTRTDSREGTTVAQSSTATATPQISSETTVPECEDVPGMDMKQLEEACKRLGMNCKGKKAVLQARVQARLTELQIAKTLFPFDQR